MNKRSFRLELFEALAVCPKGDSDLGEWVHRAEEGIGALKSNAASESIVIYANGRSALINGVLAKVEKVTPADGNDLQSHFPTPYETWCIQKSMGGGDPHRVYLEPPFQRSCSSLEDGEPLLYRRSFSGVEKGPPPIEMSQKLVHSLDLHYLADRKAYCRLDKRGDIEEVIKIVERDVESTENFFYLVSILRKDLDTYMALSGTCLVLRFDFTRVKHDSFWGWGDIDHYNKEEDDLYYHGGTDGQGSFCNGAAIVRPNVTVQDLVLAWIAEDDSENKEYASFKIYDRKNDRNIETSCAPDFLSNYFQKSDLPWEISPAFFRPELLQRFKADTDKYELQERSINCRGAWYLETYDINEKGQVHTYIGYLAKLPYEEQLYWQSFNEWPKGPISARAQQTDIEGDWDTQYDPLRELRGRVANLDTNPPTWWKARGEELLSSIHHPVTDSVKEWGDEILALDQCIVEGFRIKPLRRIGRNQGLSIDEKWGSLRILQELLSAYLKDEEMAQAAILPLQELHLLRNVVKGHSAEEKKRLAEADAIRKHESLPAHFTQLASDCDHSFAKILDMLNES